MAYGDSEAEEMDAVLAEDRIRHWQQQAKEQFPESAKLQAEIERLQREMVSEVAKERQMWKNAIVIVLANPDDIRLIGDPSKENTVRDALAPVAALQRDLETAQAALTKAGKDKSDSEEQIATLQRENAELATAIQTNNEYLVKTEDEWEARCDAFEAKLAAAEADRDVFLAALIETRSAVAAIGRTLGDALGAVRVMNIKQNKAAALDAAKTAEPDYCETDETADFLRRENSARGDKSE